VETIDENESKYEKESISSRTAREQIQSTSVPPTTTEQTKPVPSVPTAPSPTKGVRNYFIHLIQITSSVFFLFS
jgi:hypothetical protein